MTRALKATVVIAVITALVFVWSMAWAQTKTVQGKTATVTTSKILVTKHPNVVKLEQPVSSKYVVAPKPLTRPEREAYAREILKGAGIKKVELPPQVVKVRLTPDAPRSGFNWYEIHKGYNHPFPKNDKPAHTYIYGLKSGTSYILIHFERTVPNKLYMLDLAVSSPNPDKTQWIFSGAVEGEIKPQSGHLVAGFVANRAVSEIKVNVRKVNITIGLIYSVELTQVD